MSKQVKEIREKEKIYDKQMLSIVALWEAGFTAIIWRLYHMAAKFNKLGIISLMLWKTVHPDFK